MDLKRKISTTLLTAVFSLQAVTMAAAADLTSVRYHSGEEHDRVVFDWSAMPNYTVKAAEDGREITFDFHDATEKGFVKKPFHSSRIESVKYTTLNGHVLVKVRFKEGLAYKVGKLDNPARVYVDFSPALAQQVQCYPILSNDYERHFYLCFRKGMRLTSYMEDFVRIVCAKLSVPFSMPGEDTPVTVPLHRLPRPTGE